MIKLVYDTDEGRVEASFNTLDEMVKFQEDLRNKEMARAKAEEEAQEELKKKKEEELLAMARDFEKKRDELHAEMRELMIKAKNYGMSPSCVVDIIKNALKSLAEPDIPQD